MLLRRKVEHKVNVLVLVVRIGRINVPDSVVKLKQGIGLAVKVDELSSREFEVLLEGIR